jgi:cation transporter-like permease
MRGVLAVPASRSLFGDLVIVVFLVCQALDGVFTYVGLQSFGPSIEANPLICAALPYFGGAATLAGAKLVAALLGIALHLTGVHRVVAALTALYLCAAVTPWTVLLLAR